jgi:uncharacterized membrane protein YfcA
LTYDLAEIIAIIALGFTLGGVLKGATGIGAPIIAVPLLSVYFDVRFAIVIFSIPNVLPNVWQIWSYRRTILPRPFILAFAGTGMLGAAAGTWVLANAPLDWLPLGLAAAVFLYIAFRLARPHWRLSYERGLRLAAPVGFVAGAMQTAAGLSAPVSVTFLSAMKLERAAFIPTISSAFVALGIVQIPMLIWYGFLTPERAVLSTAALIPLIAGMPLGAWLGRRLPREVFDKAILAVLFVLAVRLVIG